MERDYPIATDFEEVQEQGGEEQAHHFPVVARYELDDALEHLRLAEENMDNAANADINDIQFFVEVANEHLRQAREIIRDQIN